MSWLALTSPSYFFTVGGWGHGGGLSSRLSAQRRPVTPSSTKPPTSTNNGAMKALTKSTSTPQLPRSAPSPGGVLNTIPDPRTPSPSRRPATASERPFTPNQHPDLSNEVAALSTKLINAINHQTNLDDNLQAARHELQEAYTRIAQLEVEAKDRQRQMRAMVKKEEYDRMEKQLRKEIEAERNSRLAADRERKRMENELETLTTALFEEANTMVAAARKETEASEKRVEHYKTQVQDTNQLLASQQEQLQDLKRVMAQMTAEQEEKDTTSSITDISTPAIALSERASRNFEQASIRSSPDLSNGDMEPLHPLAFAHLISPVLRTDIQAYNEFQELLKTAKTQSSAPSSRAASGNYGGLNVMGLGTLANLSTASLNMPQTSSDSSLPGSASPKPEATPLPSLKELKFYKRALTEDIEPTLRLDNAPGLSWLARRSVLSAMTAGSLTIEPQPHVAFYRGPVFACSLCGECRVSRTKDKAGQDPYARKHRFRTSDERDAQRYPLCDFCLTRVRSCCDYIAFLRMCRDGHWRAENGDEEKSAWEETVKLRERMFWARLGGGVVPNYSPRSPFVQRRRSKAESSQLPRRSLESEFTSHEQGPNGSHMDKGEANEAHDVFQDAHEKQRLTFDKTINTDHAAPLIHHEQKQDSAIALDSDDERRIEAQAAKQLENETLRRSRDLHAQKHGPETVEHVERVSTDSDRPMTPEKKAKRRSAAPSMPGGFE
ncbi:hypothetical protein IWX46DRAFT_631566 [Phyllosticta citricarpa]|uniref:GDP/GTP exchange factor Sec2 N-terminal domain-containing protein n=1 Tax=Phyllosticta citricarpa TaxID=55181 RepID=A0ABR1MRL7_9PEZI